VNFIERCVSKTLTASRKKRAVKIVKGLAITTHSEGKLINVQFIQQCPGICTRLNLLLPQLTTVLLIIAVI